MALQKPLYFQYIIARVGERRRNWDLAWIMLKEDLAHTAKPKGEEVEISLGAGEK